MTVIRKIQKKSTYLAKMYENRNYIVDTFFIPNYCRSIDIIYVIEAVLKNILFVKK